MKGEARNFKFEHWICDPPNVLMFQVNRLTHEGKKFDKFTFPFEISTDKFLVRHGLNK